MNKPYRIAVAGNPNCGKTTLFNSMTGSHHRVGNYPGVTVEQVEGTARAGDTRLEMTDLPGTYSLSASSEDERVARDFLLEQELDAVIDVVDASNLERNLYLTVQLIEMEQPVVVALNMFDVAERRRKIINASRMSQLLNCPVIPTIGKKAKGVSELLEACAQVCQKDGRAAGIQINYGHEVDEEVSRVSDVIAEDSGLAGMYPLRWLAVALIEKDKRAWAILERSAGDAGTIREVVENAIERLENHFGDDSAAVIAEARYGFVSGILLTCLEDRGEMRRSLTHAVDTIVCNRVLGPIILVGVVYGLFVTVIKIGQDWEWLFGKSPSGWVEAGFEWLGQLVMPLKVDSPMLYSMLHDGAIGGVGGIMTFVPLIFIMFMLIAVLEDTGYMARIAFVLDRALKFFGLQGKSIISMIISGGLGGGGCAVPGIMAARVLNDPKDRLVTMLVSPLMSCGAKLPVFLLLVPAFFPGYEPLVLFVIWGLSWVFALTGAWILRRFVIKGDSTSFVMELPVYHLPTVRGLLRHTWMRTWMFIRKAGTLILGASIVMWAAMYFPHLETSTVDPQISVLENVVADMEKNPPEGEEEVSPELLSKLEELKSLEYQRHAETLQYSLAGRIGKFFAPVSELAGFDWRDNIALVGGFAAKEVVVGTLGVAYSMGDTDPEESQPLADRLATDPGWNPIKAIALIVFVMIYAPCVACQAMLKQESGQWKWVVLSLAGTTSVAFVLAVLIYQIGILIFKTPAFVCL